MRKVDIARNKLIMQKMLLNDLTKAFSCDMTIENGGGYY